MHGLLRTSKCTKTCTAAMSRLLACMQNVPACMRLAWCLHSACMDLALPFYKLPSALRVSIQTLCFVWMLQDMRNYYFICCGSCARNASFPAGSDRHKHAAQQARVTFLRGFYGSDKRTYGLSRWVAADLLQKSYCIGSRVEPFS